MFGTYAQCYQREMGSSSSFLRGSSCVLNFALLGDGGEGFRKKAAQMRLRRQFQRMHSLVGAVRVVDRAPDWRRTWFSISSSDAE